MTRIRAIPCFHPTGKGEPVAVHYMRGCYWNECRMNRQKLSVPVTDEKHSALLVLPEGVGAPPQDIISPALRSAAGLFTGEFIWEGVHYGPDSVCIVCSSRSRYRIRRYARRLYRNLHVPMILKFCSGRETLFIVDGR